MSFLQEYTLLGELGTGGYATVYKVRHNTLGYIRAIRVLNMPVANEDSPIYQKFLRECKVLLRLGNGAHPKIVHIYQPRLVDNHALVEMDYVDGMDISHYLREQGNFVPVDEVLRMVVEMSSALAYCHADIYKHCMDPDEDNLERDPVDGKKLLIDKATRDRLIEKYKVIHNDIHSGNIMRREDGSYVLLDFGLAITSDDDVRKSSRHENGVEEFKAPEKWDDDSVQTEQWDIYSFGVVMYEYLAGRLPFLYDTTCPKIEASNKLLKQHKEQQPPKIYDFRKAYFEAKFPGKNYEKDYPDWLETAIMKCLEKNPANRFRNGKELYEFIVGPHEDGNTIKKDNELDDLEESYNRLGAEVQRLKDENNSLKNQLNKQTEPKRTNKWLYIILAVALLLVGGGLWLLLGRESEIDTVHNDGKLESEIDTVQEYVAQFDSNASEILLVDGEDTIMPNVEPINRPKVKPNVEPKVKDKKYWFGRYEGFLNNGIPEGRGTMYYNSHVQIAKYNSDGTERFAEQGDYFVGNWKNGDIITGSLYDKEGVLKYKIRGKGRTRPYDLEKDEYIK